MSTEKCTWVFQLYSCSQVLFHEYEYRKLYSSMSRSTSTTTLICLTDIVHFRSPWLRSTSIRRLENQYSKDTSVLPVMWSEIRFLNVSVLFIAWCAIPKDKKLCCMYHSKIMWSWRKVVEKRRQSDFVFHSMHVIIIIERKLSWTLFYKYIKNKLKM